MERRSQKETHPAKRRTSDRQNLGNNSLKYFCEEAPQYHIIAASSLLGVAVKKRKMTVPVGKVNIVNMFPVTFKEFLRASDIRTYAVWHSLLAQLSKENRKFVWKVIKTGARSKDYEDALLWLVDAGMIYQVFNISKPGMPLSAYEDRDAFKVYACDCGLLRRLAHLPASVVTDPIANYTKFKGAMAENAVLQSIMPFLDDRKVYYWTSPGTAEIEFVIQWDNEIIPIEVKAEDNISGSSLSVYNKKYEPLHRIRFSMLNLQFNGRLLSSPAPLASWFDKLMTLVK